MCAYNSLSAHVCVCVCVCVSDAFTFERGSTLSSHAESQGNWSSVGLFALAQGWIVHVYT